LIAAGKQANDVPRVLEFCCHESDPLRSMFDCCDSVFVGFAEHSNGNKQS